MNTGDLVKFSRAHVSLPGLEYCRGWVGLLLNMNSEKVKIFWSHGVSQESISEYDAAWWNKLDYLPFEVIHESR